MRRIGAPVVASWFRAGALLGLLAAPALASTALPGSGPRVEVVRRDDDLFAIDGRFTVSASTAAAWSVITDYAGIPTFVTSMKKSRVSGALADGTLIVEQTAVGRMFLISKKLHVKLEVRRDPGRMTFEDVGRADFWIYSGSWSVQAAPEGCEVRYRLLAQPDFPAPGFLLGGAMRRGARELLDQVRAEIQRRAAATSAANAP